MTAAIVALIMSALELVVLWTGWTINISHEWVETLLMVLTPIFVWLVPSMTRRE